VFSSAEVSPSDWPMACSSGAWLNHTTKVMKNTSQLRCSTFILPVNENRLNSVADMPLSKRPHRPGNTGSRSDDHDHQTVGQKKGALRRGPPSTKAAAKSAIAHLDSVA